MTAVHLPVLPSHLAHAGPSKDGSAWVPKESFSPSQLTTYSDCQRKWAWRYLFGLRELRKTKGAMLGSLIHACLELYLHGGTVGDLVGPAGELRTTLDVWQELQGYTFEEQRAMVAEAPKRALVGIEHLPRLHECEIVEVESWIDIDTARLIGGIEPIRVVGKIDLRVRRAGRWYTFDHKSTKGRRGDPWAYVKAPDTLLDDPQGVFYPLDGMHKHGLESIWARWVYYQTDPKVHPMSKAVDFEAHREATERAAFEWLIVAVEMRRMVREARAGTLQPDDIPPPRALPPDPASPCLSFGGCPYRAERGGPCRAGATLDFGSLILENKGVPDMNLAEKLAAARGSNAQNAAALAVGVIPTSAGAMPPPAPMPPPAAVQAVMPPPSALLPPEAYTPPPAAPAPAQAVERPPLPPGWEWGPDNVPRQAAAAPAASSAPMPPPVAAAAPPPPAEAAAAPRKRGRKSKAEKEAEAAAAAAQGAPMSPPATDAVELPPAAPPNLTVAQGSDFPLITAPRFKLKATFADGTIVEVPCPAALVGQVEASILSALG
jgi:hypothetical protein